jgi:hypothetical protein
MALALNRRAKKLRRRGSAIEMANLETMRFDNRQLRRLPVNPDTSRLTVPTGKVSGAHALWLPGRPSSSRVCVPRL